MRDLFWGIYQNKPFRNNVLVVGNHGTNQCFASVRSMDDLVFFAFCKKCNNNRKIACRVIFHIWHKFQQYPNAPYHCFALNFQSSRCGVVTVPIVKIGVSPAGPVGPVGPVAPSTPAGPVGPVGPVGPYGPVSPGKPFVPVNLKGDPQLIVLFSIVVYSLLP